MAGSPLLPTHVSVGFSAASSALGAGQLGIAILDPEDTTFALPDLPSSSTELSPGLERFVATLVHGGTAGGMIDMPVVTQSFLAVGPGFAVASP